ncbi:DUF2303 family protein [Pseudoduganella sp. FT55W]|uniref:DUF2303 family protein n=1 Tax=Duganella rivi TaxID=2666083 RepID=A0A7X4GL13_9BURK|nr:DUF2303 family protein [Duganella rivi]MYM65460.1 DUF2303 family protein [Duganella rivi]
MSDQNQTAGVAALAATPGEHIHLAGGILDKLLAQAAASNAVVTSGGVTQLLAPPDYKATDLTAAIEAARMAPSRKKGTVHLGDLDSFLTYVIQQGDPQRTRVYADVESRTLTAIFNDHQGVADGDAAGWRDHRAVYTAELSKEFENWLGNNGKPMEQEPFAIFLEDNIADVVEPSGDTLMTVALTLQAKNEVNFSSSRRLDNGQVQLQYTENLTTTAGGAAAMEVPRTFAIGTRLFKGGEGYKISARLKLRVGNGKVKFWYELDRPHLAIEDAFKAYVEQARAGKFTLLIGKA